jgi:hypothetical protein
MTRLELIMSKDDTKNDDTDRDLVLALLSESVDRSLTDDENATVARAMREDPSLAALRQGFMQGKALLRDVERPRAPDDLVPRVHRALAAERRGASEQKGVDDVIAAGARSRWPSFGLALAGAAAIALVIVLAPPDGGEAGVGTAGMGAEETASAVVDVSGLLAADVLAMARADTLGVVQQGEDVVVTGDARAVHQFLLTMRARAMNAGGVVRGVVPEEGTVQLTIHVTTTP